ncbi:MAG: LamG domain-containing protein, partial [Planctomycetota bacterium]
MPDYWETHYGLDPCDPCDASSNADSDALTNLQEYQNGTDPTDEDTDDDDMDDGWEVDESFNPLDATDAVQDFDSDSYSNVCEYLHNTEPDDLNSVPTTNVTIDVPDDAGSIQSAIDASIDGDVIEVQEGTYYETIDVGGKIITLQGTDPNDWDNVAATIIDANDMGTAVTFAGTEDPNCLLKGFTITGGNYGSAIDSGLVGYWKLDSDPNDSTDNSRDGTINGNPVWDPNGYIDGALDFDGTDDYVEIEGFQGVTRKQARTCTAWIKTTTEGDIIFWGDTSGSIWLFWIDGSGRIGITTFTGYKKSNADFRDNQWHHVAVVWTEDFGPNTDDIKLYVDGEELTDTVVSSGAINTNRASNVRIGVLDPAPGGNHRWFNGRIDDVRIYDRALSTAEITKLYRSGGGINGNNTQAGISYCMITDNSAGHFGGGIKNCLGTIRNCVIAHNTAGAQGGGLDNCGDVTSCTIADNTAPLGGALADCAGAVTNCIIWDNGNNPSANSSNPNH